MSITSESVSETLPRPATTTTPLRQILRGTVWYGLTVAVGRVAPGIMTVILARWLEPPELGVISFVLAYYGVLLLVADWSIAYALQKLIPENSHRVGQIAWTALFVRLTFSAVLGLLCWGLDAATGVFHGYGVYLALLVIASAFGTIVYVHNAQFHFAAGSLFSIFLQVGWVVIALVLVKAGMRITGPLLGLCISFAALGVFGFLLSRRLWGQVTFLRSIAMEILRFGEWATLAMLLSTFADQVGILVLAYRMGDAPAGIFKVATTFGMAPALLGMIVALPLMPVAKQALLNGEDVSSSLVRPIVRYLLMLGLPITAAGFVLAPAVVRMFVPESYLGAVWPLRILLGASLLRMLVTALSGVLFVGEGLKELAKIHGTVAAVALIGSVFGVRIGGAGGVAIANLLAWAAGAVLLYGWFERGASLRLEWGWCVRYAGSAVVMAALVFFAARLFQPPVERFFVGGCSAAVVYVFLLWIQRDLAFQGLARTVRRLVAE